MNLVALIATVTRVAVPRDDAAAYTSFLVALWNERGCTPVPIIARAATADLAVCLSAGDTVSIEGSVCLHPITHHLAILAHRLTVLGHDRP